jgi:WXG100 family type VII secretion target
MGVELIHEAFRTAISDVATGAETLVSARDAADARVGGFLRSGWTGVAADSFVDAWDEWKVAAGDVLDGLVAMQQLLDAAHRDFVQADEGSQQALDSISARIVERLG